MYQKIKYHSDELENIILSLIKTVSPKKRDTYESTADISDSDIAACLIDTNDVNGSIFNIQAVNNFTLIYASIGRSIKTLRKLYKLIAKHSGTLPNIKVTLSGHICAETKGSLGYLLY